MSVISFAIATAAKTLKTSDARIAAYLTHAQVLAEDGLTLAESGDLLSGLVELAVGSLLGSPLAGEEKKARVMGAVAALYDSLAPNLPWPMWLAPVKWLLAPVLRAGVLAALDGVIEATYARLKPRT